MKIETIRDPQEWVAACGLNCRLCLFFGRRCAGCRGDDCAKSKVRRLCKMRTCAERPEGERFCSPACGQFPCERLRRMDKRYRAKYGTSVVENLRRIAAEGVERFVAFDLERWTCPQCGGLMTVHEPACPGCGYAWRG
jgi:hypothetical protein